MNNKVKLAALALPLALMAGCATIAEGTTQDMTVLSAPENNAFCTLTNGKGRWNTKTPGTVRVAKSVSAMNIACNKAGYDEGRVRVPSKPNVALAGNIIIGGIPGAAIDTVSGAGFTYPHNVNVVMPKKQHHKPKKA